MMSKLESKPDSQEKLKMLETIEGKIVALQSELQDVRQQRAVHDRAVSIRPRVCVGLQHGERVRLSDDRRHAV